MMAAIDVLGLTIPMKLNARSFVGRIEAGTAHLSSVGANARTRLWPLAGNRSLSLLTSESNEIVGVVGEIEVGAPAATASHSDVMPGEGVSITMLWKSRARLRATGEKDLAVLEFEGKVPVQWYELDSGVHAARSAEGHIAAIAFRVEAPEDEQLEIVFDPDAEYRIQATSNSVHVSGPGGEDGDGFHQRNVSLCAGLDGQIGLLVLWSDVSAGEAPPELVGRIDSPITLRASIEHGYAVQRFEGDDESWLILELGDGGGAWLRLGDLPMAIRSNDAGAATGIAVISSNNSASNAEFEPGRSEAAHPVIELDDSVESASVDTNSETSNAKMAEIFDRAMNTSFPSIGLVGWDGRAVLSLEDAQWMPERDPMRVELTFTGPDGKSVDIESRPIQVDKPGGPKLAPRAFRHAAINHVVEATMGRPSNIGDPDHWVPSQKVLELRNRLDHAPWKSVTLKTTDGAEIDTQVVIAGDAWSAIGFVGEVEMLICAEHVAPEDLCLDLDVDLERFRSESLAELDGSATPLPVVSTSGDESAPQRIEPVVVGEAAAESFKLIEEVVRQLVARWQLPHRAADIQRLLSSEQVIAGGEDEDFAERVMLYQAISHGRGFQAPRPSVRVTADGQYGCANLVLVKQTADADPRGYSTGWASGGNVVEDGLPREATATDIVDHDTFVDIKLRMRREGDQVVIATNLLAVLEQVYGVMAAAIQPVAARPVQAPIHELRCGWVERATSADADRVVDCDVRHEFGVARIERSAEGSWLEVNDVRQRLPQGFRPYQVRWSNHDLVVVAGDRSADYANALVWSVSQQQCVVSFDRGPSCDDLAASGLFIATTFDYDDGNDPTFDGDERSATVATLGDENIQIPRGPIEEALVVHTLHGEYQLGYRSRFDHDDDIDDCYAPPMCFADDDRLFVLGDHCVVDLRLNDGHRQLHFRPKVGYREAIASNGEIVFIAATHEDGSGANNVAIWEWRPGDEWATPIGLIPDGAGRRYRGTADGTFIGLPGWGDDDNRVLIVDVVPK